MKYAGCVASLIFIGVICAYSAQTPDQGQVNTDAPQKIQALLTNFGPQPYTHPYWTTCRTVSGDPPRVHAYPCQKQTTTSNVLTAGSLRIVKSDPITFDSPTMTELPSQITATTAGWQNCSTKAPASYTEAMAVAFQRSSGVSVTNTVSRAGSWQSNFLWKVTDSLSIGGNAQITDTNSTATTDSNSYVLTVTRTATVQISLPIQSAMGVEAETWPVHYTAEFHTTVTVDADLSPNDKGYAHLADIFSEQQRTFAITGTIFAVDAATARGFNWDINYDAKRCPSGLPDGGGVITFAIPPHSTQSGGSKAVWKYQ